MPMKTKPLWLSNIKVEKQTGLYHVVVVNERTTQQYDDYNMRRAASQTSYN